jgi:glutamate N-acetyltransferase/amino-acid N-acetyltransferase
VTITGIAKGSGMIRPDMATMLAFIATDAKIEQALLDQILSLSMDNSFNRITIDGDTSTNDACVLIATGEGGVEINDFNLTEFNEAIVDVCSNLAQAIVRDGEGASKFVTIDIYINDICIVANGEKKPDYTEEMGQEVMSSEEIDIQVSLSTGNQEAKIWTTDLSYDYVKINAEYRT